MRESLGASHRGHRANQPGRTGRDGSHARRRGGTHGRHELATERKQLVVPADPAEVARLAPRYKNAALGELAVKKAGATTLFDMGEWKIEVATRKNADGTVSFVTIGAVLLGQSFVAGATTAGKRTLTLRDAQHEYVFEAE